jgi:hypothetical protein
LFGMMSSSSASSSSSSASGTQLPGEDDLDIFKIRHAVTSRDSGKSTLWRVENPFRSSLAIKQLSSSGDDSYCWPPLDTGYSISLWCCIYETASAGTVGDDGGFHSSGMQVLYMLLELSDFDSKGAAHSKYCLFVGADRKLSISLEYFSRPDGDDGLVDEEWSDSQKVIIVLDELNTVTLGDWHHVSVRHDSSGPVTVTLDGVASFAHRLDFQGQHTRTTTVKRTLSASTMSTDMGSKSVSDMEISTHSSSDIATVSTSREYGNPEDLLPSTPLPATPTPTPRDYMQSLCVIGVRSKPSNYYSRSSVGHQRFEFSLSFSNLLVMGGVLSESQVMLLHSVGPFQWVSLSTDNLSVQPELACESCLGSTLEKWYKLESTTDISLESADHIVSRDDKLRRLLDVEYLFPCRFEQTEHLLSIGDMLLSLGRRSNLLSQIGQYLTSKAPDRNNAACLIRGGTAVRAVTVVRESDDEDGTGPSRSPVQMPTIAESQLSKIAVTLTPSAKHFGWLLQSLSSTTTFSECCEVLELIESTLGLCQQEQSLSLGSEASSYFIYCLPAVLESKLTSLRQSTDVMSPSEPDSTAKLFGLLLGRLGLARSFVVENDEVADTWRSINTLSQTSITEGASKLLALEEVYGNESSWLLHGRLLELLLLNSKLWTSLPETVVSSFLRTIRDCVAVPFSRLSEINKAQLHRYHIFTYLVSLLFDLQLSNGCICEIADLLEHLIKFDFYTVDDLILLVRSFVALTVSSPVVVARRIPQAESPKDTLFSEGVPISPLADTGRASVRDKGKNSSKAALQSKKSFFGISYKSESKDSQQSQTSFAFTKSAWDALDALRNNSERCKFVRRILAAVLLQASSWFGLLQSYFAVKPHPSIEKTASRLSLESNRSRSSSVGLRNRGIIRALPIFSRRFSRKFKRKTGSKAKVKEPVNSWNQQEEWEDICAEGLLFEVDEAKRSTLESFMQCTGTKGVSSLVTALPLPQIVFMIYQCLDSTVASTQEDAARVGLMRLARRHRDPMVGLLLLQVLVGIRSHYPGSKKSLWIRELELYVPALFECLIQFDGGNSASSQDPFLTSLVAPDVPKRIRIPGAAATAESAGVHSRLDITGMENIETDSDSGVTDRNETGPCDITDILQAAAGMQRQYYPSASSCANQTISRPVISQFFEAVMDILLGSQRSFSRIVVPSLSNWNFTSLEPVYLPAGHLTAQEDVCAFTNSGSELNDVTLGCASFMAATLEVGRVSAEISTLEAALLQQQMTNSANRSSAQESGVTNINQGQLTSTVCKATVTTLLCSLSAVFYHSPAVRKQLLATKLPGARRSSGSTRSRLVLDDLLAGVVQIFYSVVKSQLLSMLLKGTFEDSESSPSPSASLSASPPEFEGISREPSSEFAKSVSTENSELTWRNVRRASYSSQSPVMNEPVKDGVDGGVSVQMHRPSLVMPAEDLGFEPTLDEWTALPSEMIHRACWTALSRLCIQLISQVAVQRLLDSSYQVMKTADKVDDAINFGPNSAWAMALASPPVASAVNMPQITTSQVSHFLNNAVRRRIVAMTSLWIQRQYELYVEVGQSVSGRSEIEVPTAETVDSAGSTPAPSSKPTGKSAKVMSSLAAPSGASLHCVTADLLCSVSEVITQLACFESGNTVCIDSVSTGIVGSLEMLIQLSRFLRDTVMENTLPAAVSEPPHTPPKSPPSAATTSRKSWFGKARADPASPTSSGAAPDSPSASQPKKSWWSSMTSRRSSESDPNKGRFSERWKEEEVLELCSGIEIVLLHVRRAAIMLMETHHHGNMIISHKVMRFIMKNVDLLFSKDIFPVHLSAYSTPSTLSKTFRMSGFTANPHVAKFFKGDKTRSGHSIHDRYFAAALTYELLSLMMEDDTKTRMLAMTVWGALLNSSLQVMGRRLFVLDKTSFETNEAVNIDLWNYHGGGFSVLQSVTEFELNSSNDMTQPSAASETVSESHRSEINPSITFYAWFGVLPEYIRNALEANLHSQAQVYAES